MPLPEIDATLARFGSAIDVMTANLLELDDNPTNKLLDPAGLSGVTATRIATARQTLSRLWEHFSQFKDLVERAKDLRGTGRPSAERVRQLDQLLHGQSITMPPIEVPLASRGLLTPAETPVSTTPDQLLTDMVTAFDNAKHDILAVDQAWRQLVPRLEEIDREVTRLSTLADDLHEPSTPMLARARQASAELSRHITGDPLSVQPGQIDALQEGLRSLSARLDDLVQQRDTLSAALADSQSLVAETEELIVAGTTALEETRRKIAGPSGLLEPLNRECLTDPRRGLAPWLARLAAMAQDGNWRAARKGLDEWTRVATATRDAAREVAQANAAPLRERDELRGRLDAFRAKAGALGHSEDAQLSDLADRAHTALFTAPTDLVAAAALVKEFGTALGGQRR